MTGEKGQNWRRRAENTWTSQAHLFNTAVNLKLLGNEPTFKTGEH